MSFEFIATIASKLFVFKVEILENARSYPFSQIHSHILTHDVALCQGTPSVNALLYPTKLPLQCVVQPVHKS